MVQNGGSIFNAYLIYYGWGTSKKGAIVYSI